ncbi:hypothetical protein GCM10023189_31240 [Nibrella saemangeumensis]|uniref:Uncharacterized protein n=1 Tax=Nibrella saemangeumensis TaxID=1084526 RepID=A0ABP8N120_9BACT
MEASNPTYYMPVAETQAVVMDWVKATEEFYQRYFQINEVINGAQRARYSRPRKKAFSDRAHNPDKMQALLKLRKQMSDVLTTLMVDMTAPKPVRQPESSKPGKLMVHTRLLEDLNRNVAHELSRLTSPQA